MGSFLADDSLSALRTYHRSTEVFMGHWHDVRADLRDPASDLREHIPEVYRGFAELSSSSLKDGVISAALKEVIALALGVAAGCDGCIAAHARAAAKKGASPQQVAEVLGVAIMMGGGPATVYAPRAWEAYQEFLAAEKAE
jgi:AhpD family alkylhydroperoxidase